MIHTQTKHIFYSSDILFSLPHCSCLRDRNFKISKNMSFNPNLFYLFAAKFCINKILKIPETNPPDNQSINNFLTRNTNLKYNYKITTHAYIRITSHYIIIHSHHQHTHTHTR